MRDGNFLSNLLSCFHKKVVSLPMRDGNWKDGKAYFRGVIGC